jgi:hypothetical protein
MTTQTIIDTPNATDDLRDILNSPQACLVSYRPRGGTKYGWRLLKDYRVPLAKEQAILWAILVLRQRGYSYEKIAITLNNAGIESKQDRGWQRASVRSCLKHFVKAIAKVKQSEVLAA